MLDRMEIKVGLFSGQGGFRKGVLGRSWDDGDEEVHEVFAAVDAAAAEILDKTVSARVFGADRPGPEALFAADPEILQLSIFAVSVGAYRLLAARGGRLDALLGHSLGEIAALVSGGAFALGDGAALICHRIAATTGLGADTGGMAALGCGAEGARRILDLVGGDGLVVAVDNGPRRVVVSGPVEALAKVEAVAAAVGITAVRLLVPVAFHNPALAELRADVRERLRPYKQSTLRSPVYSPILGRFYRDSDDLIELLSLHLVAPVHFGAALRHFHAAGARIFVEVGAGSTLTNLVREAHPEVKTLAPLAGGDESEALDAAAAFLRYPEAPEIPAQRDTELTHDEVVTAVRSLYAEALEYPEEVLTEDAHLEADLGIDSVQRTELLARLRGRFGLGEFPPELRASDYDTFGAVVGLVESTMNGAVAGGR